MTCKALFGGKDLSGAIDPAEDGTGLQILYQCSAKEGRAKWQIFYDGLM